MAQKPRKGTHPLQDRFPSLILHNRTELIFLPSLDLDVSLLHVAECLDEGTCQTGVRHQRNVMVDRGATDLVTVGQLTSGLVLRDIDNQIYLMFL